MIEEGQKTETLIERVEQMHMTQRFHGQMNRGSESARLPSNFELAENAENVLHAEGNRETGKQGNREISVFVVKMEILGHFKRDFGVED